MLTISRTHRSLWEKHKVKHESLFDPKIRFVSRTRWLFLQCLKASDDFILKAVVRMNTKIFEVNLDFLRKENGKLSIKSSNSCNKLQVPTSQMGFLPHKWKYTFPLHQYLIPFLSGLWKWLSWWAVSVLRPFIKLLDLSSIDFSVGFQRIISTLMAILEFLDSFDR